MTDGFLTIYGHRDNLFARQSDPWITGHEFPVLFPLRPGRKCVVAVSGNTLEARWTA